MLKPSSWFGDMVRLQWQPLGDAKQVRADRHHSRQLKSGIAFLLALAIATPLAAHGARDHWIIPAESSQLESTAGTMTSLVAALSQDIGRIAFEADRTGNFDIYVMSADGSGVTNLTNHIAQVVARRNANHLRIPPHPQSRHLCHASGWLRRDQPHQPPRRGW